MPTAEWGDFEWGDAEWGSADAGGGSTHPVDRITQLAPAGIPGRRYGSFAGKAGAAPTAFPWLHYVKMRGGGG